MAFLHPPLHCPIVKILHWDTFFEKPIKIVLNAQTQEYESNQKKHEQNIRLKQKALSHPIVKDALEIFNGKIIGFKNLQEN